VSQGYIGEFDMTMIEFGKSFEPVGVLDKKIVGKGNFFDMVAFFGPAEFGDKVLRGATAKWWPQTFLEFI